MATQLFDSRPVLSQPQHEFGVLLGKVLSPSRPLQSEEFLRGREEQLLGIKKALYQPGRHVLIHGFRGVGKSSLAQTSAFSLSTQADPLIISCDKNSTIGSIVKDIFEEAARVNPKIEKKVKEFSTGLANLGLSFGAKVTVTEGSASTPSSVNESVRYMQFLCDTYAENPVVVIDEFDQLNNKAEQENFANFVKQVSDKHISVRFIVCGIGDSIDALMSAHGSADRYFYTVSLQQIAWEARYDIVTEAARSLGIEIDENTLIRIARISDGFPHYVHFISEKLFWRVYEAKNGGKVTGDLFLDAMTDASREMDMKLRGPYEIATQKYSDDYECVLWAAADGHEFKRRSVSIYESYVRIMEDLSAKGQTPRALPRDKFNQRINSLKRPSHACILTGSRQGWYEFTEKVVRGYVRLRAEQRGVILEVDHPAVKRRIKPQITF